MKNEEWISTGKAADMLGYSRDHFRDKFDPENDPAKALIPCRRINGGYRKWHRESVQKLVEESAGLKKAG